MSQEFRRILVLPSLHIQNANALSSPFTIGFPAMTAWLGAMHALQRSLRPTFPSLECLAIAVLVHDVALQTYRGPEDFMASIITTANPLTEKGERPPIMEAPRCHLQVSLLIEYRADEDIATALIEQSRYQMQAHMRIAGGDIMQCDTAKQAFVTVVDNGDAAEINGFFQRVFRCAKPGYVLKERRDLLVEAMAAGQDAMDALLDSLVVFHHCEKKLTKTEATATEAKQQGLWSSKRLHEGWIVPIATGFHGLTELTSAKNQRDATTPHRFAESVMTLGEFLMPIGIESLDDVFWRYYVDEDKDLYLCQPLTQTTKNL